MAYEIRVFDISLVAGVDLSNSQFKFVSVNNTGRAVLAGAGERAVGVVQNDPGLDETATVRNLGITKMTAGGNVVAGNLIASGANGVGVVAAEGNEVMGIALDGAANGEVFSLLIQASGQIPVEV